MKPSDTHPLAAGLFIGINKYPRLRSERHLQAAERDASRLHAYFTSAGIAGPFDLAIEDGNWRPTRANLIAKFSKFVAAVRPGTAGLVYFAGHGYSLHSGLVLAGSDFIPAVGWDSGIPIRRLFELAKEQRRRNVLFLFLLDCCRSGSNQGLPDDVPANVLVTYACSHGNVAMEDGDGGLLTSALIRALDQISTSNKSNQPSRNIGSCGFHVILDGLQQEYLAITRDPKSQVEIIGARPDLLQFPLLSSNSCPSAPSASPACMLSGPPNPEQLSADIDSIRAVVKLWSGLRLNDESIQLWLGQMVIWNAEKQEISVVLQSIGPFATGEVLLHELVNRFSSVFESLRFEWPTDIDPNLFRTVFAARDGVAWIETPDGDLGVRWNNVVGEIHTSGQGWIIERSKRKTIFHFECQNSQGDQLTLSYLQPSIIEVYQLLNSLKGNPSHEI